MCIRDRISGATGALGLDSTAGTVLGGSSSGWLGHAMSAVGLTSSGAITTGALQSATTWISGASSAVGLDSITGALASSGGFVPGTMLSMGLSSSGAVSTAQNSGWLGNVNYALSIAANGALQSGGLYALYTSLGFSTGPSGGPITGGWYASVNSFMASMASNLLASVQLQNQITSSVANGCSGYVLSVTVVGAGAVSSSAPGPSGCTSNVASGTSVTLTATPASDYSFMYFYDAVAKAYSYSTTYTLTMPSAAYEVVAYFGNCRSTTRYNLYQSGPITTTATRLYLLNMWGTSHTHMVASPAVTTRVALMRASRRVLTCV